MALNEHGWCAGARGELPGGDRWIERVREAERGLLDFVTVEDSVGPERNAGGPRDGRLDAIMVAAHLAPRTARIGIVAVASATVSEPFLLSAQIATVDHLSGGRAGWLATVTDDAAADGYVGPRPVPAPASRHEEAAEHVEIVRRLWDSWEDDAEIRDRQTGRFLDRDKLHRIDFEGRHLSVVGPSITPRPPQGQPLVLALGGSPSANAFAAAGADIVVMTPNSDAELTSATREIDAALSAAGRDPDEVRRFVDVLVFLDEDGAVAVERRARHGARDGLAFAGTASGLAERLIAWGELGVDGFRLRPALIPHDLSMVSRRLVGELRRRGSFRSDYEATTLRGALGLARPANRYLAA